MASCCYALLVEVSVNTLSYSWPEDAAVVEEGHRVEPRERFVEETSVDETAMDAEHVEESTASVCCLYIA
jgi:hypothetical protein